MNPSEPMARNILKGLLECPHRLEGGESWCTSPGKPGVLVTGTWQPEEAAAEACTYWSQCRPVFAEFDPNDWQRIEVFVLMAGAGGGGAPLTLYRVRVSAEVKVEWNASEREPVSGGAQ